MSGNWLDVFAPCEEPEALGDSGARPVGVSGGQAELRVPWLDPTPEMLADPVFNTIWAAIKHWDINVPGAYSGYCGATGNHARAIFDAVEDKTVDPATEVQTHVDAVLSDLARDKLKPQQIKQIQHAATDAALRRAVRGVR